ncbi:MAG TPA: hypothetical protein PLT23_02200, partial [Lentisphaeria bacterium]|nr:hypothetical protein [Lentisphaeria bacterium]
RKSNRAVRRNAKSAKQAALTVHYACCWDGRYQSMTDYTKPPCHSSPQVAFCCIWITLMQDFDVGSMP